ncbi:GH3 auxin-responsive promoter family protein [uncultured Clostridium sp.]|uniref:GH3 auxin-responsive promoter family protein n=1 Tax=uncultured Clostridium sp. TaxID=59620 RepID=UPI0027DAF3A8|nr:GH3 auxin-responsive promoter family protein [uncultured Clostridium sp.]
MGAGAFVEKKFENDTKMPQEINEGILLKILKRNSRTEIGEIYNFKNIKSSEEFKEIFPITDYEYYENYIIRMAEGEENLLTSDKVEYFCHTSGTTGKQKLIPTTKRSRRSPSKYMGFLINRFAYKEFKEKWNYGRGLMIADIAMTSYTNGGYPVCSATSGGIKAIKPMLPYMYTSPMKVMEIKDKETSSYLHLLFALKEVNLLFINGVFISNVVDLFRILQENSNKLVEDIRKGKVNRTIKLDENTRHKINSYLTPDAGRADELQRIFKQGFKGVARKIWPNLLYIGSVTGANFSIYDDMLNYYTDNLPVYSPVYAATEGTIGINPFVKKIEYVIIPDTVYYEFIEEKDMNSKNPKTLCLGELKVGEKYEIILTNYMGLYRYRLGDVVRVVGKYNNTPTIEFLYRRNQVLNMVSEKTNEEHLTSAIKKTIENLNVDMVDYTTVPDNSITPGRYVFYMEVKNFPLDKKDKLEKVLDKELRGANLAYDRARAGKKLGRLKIILLRANTFKKIKGALTKNQVSQNQIKIPRVVTGKYDVIRILEENTIK